VTARKFPKERFDREIVLRLRLPEYGLAPADLVGVLKKAQKEAVKDGDIDAVEVLGKLLTLAHPSFNSMERFPKREV